MTRFFRIAGIGAAVVALLLAGAFFGAAWLGDRQLARTVDIRVVPVPYVRDAAALKLGKYLFESRGCGECHGSDGRGLAFIDTPAGLYVKAPDLTPGEGGVLARYDSADKFIAMMRTGKRPDGSEVAKAMPFMSLRNLNDVDLNAMHAYLKTLPPRKTGER